MNMNAKDVVKVIPRGNGDVMLLGVVAILALGIAAYVFVKGGEKKRVGGVSVDGDVEKKKRERNVNEDKDVKERNENTTTNTNVNTSVNTKKDNKHKGKKETKSTKQVTPVKTQNSGNDVDNQQQQQQPVINTPTLSQANVQEIITNISVIKTDKPQKEPVVTSNDDDHINTNTTNTNNNNKVNTNDVDVDVVNKNVLVEDIITTVVPPIDIAPPELQASKVEVNTNTTTTTNEADQAKPKAKKNKKKKPAKKEPKQQQQEPNLSLKPITSPEENINDDDSGWIEVGSKKDKPSTQTKQKQIAEIYKDYLNQY